MAVVKEDKNNKYLTFNTNFDIQCSVQMTWTRHKFQMWFPYLDIIWGLRKIFFSDTLYSNTSIHPFFFNIFLVCLGTYFEIVASKWQSLTISGNWECLADIKAWKSIFPSLMAYIPLFLCQVLHALYQEFLLHIPYTRHYNLLLIWNHSQL